MAVVLTEAVKRACRETAPEELRHQVLSRASGRPGHSLYVEHTPRAAGLPARSSGGIQPRSVATEARRRGERRG